jgi:NAD(P)-dependent dehydrogenase (short-subunit alcohol dehydrogenase family)
VTLCQWSGQRAGIALGWHLPSRHRITTMTIMNASPVSRTPLRVAITGALLGALAASAREGAGAQRSLVVNVTSDAAVTPYAGWGAYGASKAALAHLSRIWHEELAPHGVAVIAVNPGDMDTPLHAAALPDAVPATLKRPRDAAREIIERIDHERATTIERSAS